MFSPILVSTVLLATITLDTTAGAWRSIDDGVMGGRSNGGMVPVEAGLRFEGELSLENNGGFSSVRRPVAQDLSGMTRVRLEVRGDGREYQFRIRQNSGFDGVAWRALFSTNSDWQDIEIPFDEFMPVFRGVSVKEAGPVVASKIQQIGFLLADGKAGKFELEIRRIEFRGPQQKPAK